ncbi:HPP family protein [Polynucleobacter sp. MWH-UH35A]|uniref:HPP family protein n=1 Tax=Polynucleobacter sp. MWH-UH35A TaxID=1855619 RepID=UPI001BFDB35D|nr:HPP family protein [Polynucleobacter sp. MWH-UH35A]QWD59538.1 HPP family protein [Polynucleobacter sp. MWH-UH35A]
MAHLLIKKIAEIFHRLTLGQPKYPIKDVARITFGTGLTLFAILLLNQWFGNLSNEESMIMAVFGVSAFLIFLLPNSKLFSPLVLLEANLLAACVAFVCVYVFTNLAVGIFVTVLGTILGLHFLRCMHPPAIFLSIFIVMAGVTGYSFALYPILVDSIILAIASFLNKKYFTQT